VWLQCYTTHGRDACLQCNAEDCSADVAATTLSKTESLIVSSCARCQVPCAFESTPWHLGRVRHHMYYVCSSQHTRFSGCVTPQRLCVFTQRAHEGVCPHLFPPGAFTAFDPQVCADCQIECQRQACSDGDSNELFSGQLALCSWLSPGPTLRPCTWASSILLEDFSRVGPLWTCEWCLGCANACMFHCVHLLGAQAEGIMCCCVSGSVGDNARVMCSIMA
jgi:hypothetical protein